MYPILSGIVAEMSAWAKDPQPWWHAAAIVAVAWFGLWAFIGGIKAFWQK